MRVLVTGGGGFLGLAVVKELLARGHAVTSISRGTYAAHDELDIETAQVDLADTEAVAAACADHDAVVHCAAKTGIWGPRADYVSANVVGTRNVIEACLRHGIERLVHTSSPSVCFDGKGHRNAKNDLPYPERHLCHYPDTKAVAERFVLASNGKGPNRALATCAIRPHLVFGPGDPHLVPRLIERARAGKLRLVGDGQNEVSLTYVDNAAAAHVDALERLEPEAPHAGRAYFLGQSESVQLWTWIRDLLTALGEPAPRARVPLKVAYAAGGLCELIWNALGKESDPPMTRFVAAQLATDHSYDLEPAQRDFGYEERVSLSEGTRRVIEALQAPASEAIG